MKPRLYIKAYNYDTGPGVPDTTTRVNVQTRSSHLPLFKPLQATFEKTVLKKGLPIMGLADRPEKPAILGVLFSRQNS